MHKNVSYSWWAISASIKLALLYWNLLEIHFYKPTVLAAAPELCLQNQ